MQVLRIKIIGCEALISKVILLLCQLNVHLGRKIFESNYIDENFVENPWQQNRRALPQVSF
jgi:hypothetical protein